jgi:glycerol-3-phosphate O-acyltransferase
MSVGATVQPDPVRPPLPLPLQRSSMRRRFNWLGRLLIRIVFRRVQVPADAVARLRRLAEQGTLVYVMRYRSGIDYLLVNSVLLREGLPLAQFAPGVSLGWCSPIRDVLRLLWRRPARTRPAQHAACEATVAAGHPALIFLRSHAFIVRRRGALAAARIGSHFLRDVIRGAEESGRPVFFVPVAIFRGPGFRRRESRFTTFLYSVQDAPGEAKRLFTYLWAAEQTRLTLGREVGLHRFVDEHGREGEDRFVRRLARTLQIFLYREERVVQGPALLPRRLVRAMVLRDPELSRLSRRIAAERGVPRRAILKEARRYFDEMAANFGGFYFAILEWLFNRVWPRVFSGLELNGLPRVVECIKQNPVVLVPCHRSHFDYLILTYIFHTHHLSPPHIAAGINLSFWPMGPLFRGAGAFFIRRTFEDNELYKMVFRKYLTFLIREGYTQEFFIEGGRTRTGKILPAKLGMLSALVGAFGQGVRRDLYFVPISIHYGRIPEEEAYRREVRGEAKERESLGALLRARSILSRRFGTVHVGFGTPISLATALGPLRQQLELAHGSPAAEEERRRFVQRFAFRLLRDINGAAVAGASSVSASALLSVPHAASRIDDFIAHANALVGILRTAGVKTTASLERNVASRFRESLAWLEGGGLVQRRTDADGAVLHVPGPKRVNLDYYKNNTIHFFLIPSLLSRALVAGIPHDAITQEIVWWLDLYRWEFPLPMRDTVGPELERWMPYYRECGAVVGEAASPNHPLIRVTVELLENFREAYAVAARVIVAQAEWPVPEKVLIQRMQAQFETSLWLGEVHKPEGNSVVTFGNAVSRFIELGHIAREKRDGREKVIVPGAAFQGLPELIRHLRA